MKPPAMAACLVNGSDYQASSFAEPGRVSALLDRVGNKAAGKRVVGLFTGGTLAKEAQLLLSKELGLRGDIPGRRNSPYRCRSR